MKRPTDWYDLKAPSMFDTRNVGKTLVNRSSGLKNANDSLKGRIFELSLGDLNKDDEQTFRKIQLRVDDIQGKNCLTNFHGMDFTSDKLRSLVRKWQTLIEAQLDVKTTDGYLVRIFTIGFTKRRPNQVKKTTYAQSAQVREIRRKMFEVVQREATSCDLKQLVQKLIPEVIGREIEKASQGIYPLQNVFVRKVRRLSLLLGPCPRGAVADVHRPFHPVLLFHLSSLSSPLPLPCTAALAVAVRPCLGSRLASTRPFPSPSWSFASSSLSTSPITLHRPNPSPLSHCRRHRHLVCRLRPPSRFPPRPGPLPAGQAPQAAQAGHLEAHGAALGLDRGRGRRQGAAHRVRRAGRPRVGLSLRP